MKFLLFGLYTHRIVGCRAFHSSILSLQAKKPLHATFFLRYMKQTDPEVLDPDFFEKEALKIPLDANFIDGLKEMYWKKYYARRDIYLRSVDELIGKPVEPQAYGLPDVDKTQLRPEYAHIDALQHADEKIRKIYTIAYGNRKDLNRAWKRALLDSLGIHHMEEESLSFKVAWTTALIRHWSLLEEEKQIIKPGRKFKPPRPKWLSMKILAMVQYRNKLIKQLRATSEEEFERVAKILKLSYRVPKPVEELEVNRTRKKWTEAQIKNRINWEKENQLTALKEKFMANREQRVKEIDDEMEKLKQEEAAIMKRLEEIDQLQGKFSGKVQGYYQPDIIGDFYKHNDHDKIGFYLPKPNMVVPEESDAYKVVKRKSRTRKLVVRTTDVDDLKKLSPVNY